MVKTWQGVAAGNGENGKAVERLTALLLIEQRGTDPVVRRPCEPDFRDDEPLGVWLASAAALAAGEPKRALALLKVQAPGASGGTAPPRAHDQVRPSQPSSLSSALRTAAVAMDSNWQPGTSLVPLRPEAEVAQSTAGEGIESAMASVTDPRLRLCAHLAGRLTPVLLSSRMTLGHAAGAADAQARTVQYGGPAHWAERDLWAGTREPLKWFDGLYEEIAATRHADATACHLLLAADLRVRAGDRRAAEPLLQHVGQNALSPATAGFAALLTGDWCLGTPGTAEQCAAVPDPPDPAALSLATEHYERAVAAYQEAESLRGRAAALLRLAHIHRLRGELDACRRTVARARELAVAGGDGAYAALLGIHQQLDLIAAGAEPGAQTGPGEGAGTVESVVNWARTAGSTSWLRGMRQLVLERAEFWSARGDVVRSRRAALLAHRLTPEAEGTSEGMAAPEAGVYLRARHRLAGIVLTDLEQKDHLARLRLRTEQGERPELADCLGVIHSAKIFHDQASALRDPEVMAASRSRIEFAISVGTRFLTDVEPVETILGMLRSDLASCPAQEAFFRSRRSRSAGLEEEADRLARQALGEAERIPDEMFRRVLRCAVHVDLREGGMARAEMEVVEPKLSAIQAAGLWLRLRRPERAAPHVPFIGADGPDQDYPWERPGIHADLALARGAYGHAAGHALLGLDAYEEYRVKLARDALRASFADDQVVAGLHHTAVISLLSLGGPSAPAAAFTRAERSRAGFLDALHALDAAGTDQAALAAVRNWLAAEVRWSAEFEEHAATIRSRPAPPGPAGSSAGRGVLPASAASEPVDARHSAGGAGRGPETVAGDEAPGKPGASTPGAWPSGGGVTDEEAPRGRIEEAERALDVAEAEVLRLVPAALTASGSSALPDAAAVAEALPPGSLLLAYHLFDDALVAWAMTRQTLLAERHTRWAHAAVAAARRFHDWCSTAGASAGEADGQELAELLLRPFAAQLQDHQRVIVVPPASLSLLPFHALPWNGDILGVTHEVSYLPAASLLTRRRHQAPDRPWSELGALLVGAPACDPRHGLRELPGTAAETAEIARLMPRHRLLTGADAARAKVLEAAPGYEVLHLATHGLVDELAPNRSRLPLAGDDCLGLADLLAAAHGPQLLVLSACDTGRGRATAGGDVLGLTRAALITGARHAVVSLWPVRDSTGCLVVTKTYQHLLHDPAASVGAALARAQCEVRELSGAERDEEFSALTDRAGVRAGPASRARSWDASRDSEPLRHTDADDRHPYHWAPFIHVGV
ncbi:CHAT domain-containing protein [Streptomyces sp. ActVer]|uniref:CHAT domain-containing protein n=1 Tax=Streptomyces sp. ActVer TaxID=3014558 RepID=UPI0022B3CAF9|nr:CHAT domain-containing protein [Streptomyces sp. ActVer]MCZ4509655.1 CHAT domain-containing protein [Streptomyces sp. ActVer]